MPATPQDLFNRLDDLKVDYTTHNHPPLRTVEDSKALRGDLPGAHCKNLFFKDKKQALWLVVALEDREINVKELRHKIGSNHLSFGKPDLLLETLGVIPGAVTPFALLNDLEQKVNVVLDAEMMQAEFVNYHPLTNEQTTTVTPAALRKFIHSCGHEFNEVEL